jgi:hypothetical protein
MGYINQPTPSKIKEIKSNFNVATHNPTSNAPETVKKTSKKPSWSTSYDLQLKN